jgi:hypothetical protein
MKVNTGVIFDAHMLKHEVGLDIDSIFAAPKPLSPTTLHLAGPDGTELQGFSLLHLPAAIISALGSPFRWIWGKLSHRSPKAVFSFEQEGFVSEGEAQEELDDALCPIYGQLDKHIYWKVVEWIPCKLPPNLSPSAAMSSYGAQRDYKKAECRGGRFGTHPALQVCVSPLLSWPITDGGQRH